MKSAFLILFLPLLPFVTATPTHAQEGSRAHNAAANPQVATPNGPVIGTTANYNGKTYDLFMGIPFAQTPPVRWTVPVPPTKWTKPKYVQNFKPTCIQQFNYPAADRAREIALYNNPGYAVPAEDEDCLYVNVFKPSTPPPPGGFPVIAYFYGGNLDFGASQIHLINASKIVTSQDVILVSGNARTGVFGFPNSPEVPYPNQNLGLIDQRFMLTWIQENIGSFNGNKDQVMLFGESSGGWCVQQLMAIPQSPLPFSSAFISSPGQGHSNNGSSPWALLVNAVGCKGAASELECMRKVPAETLNKIDEQNPLSFGPSFDGVTASGNLENNVSNKTYANVPFLYLTTTDEATIFAYQGGISPNITQADFLNIVKDVFPNDPITQGLVELTYPLTLFDGSAYKALITFVTDFVFTCPAASFTNRAHSMGYKVWRAQFGGVYPNVEFFPQAGAYHSADLFEEFGNFPDKGATGPQIGLSNYMQKFIVQMAANPAGGPGWPQIGLFNQTDVAGLGQGNTTDANLLSRQKVDGRCAIYTTASSAGAAAGILGNFVVNGGSGFLGNPINGIASLPGELGMTFSQLGQALGDAFGAIASLL